MADDNQTGAGLADPRAGSRLGRSRTDRRGGCRSSLPITTALSGACDGEVARRALPKRYGADETKWVWGSLWQSSFPHPLAAVPLIGGQFADAGQYDRRQRPDAECRVIRLDAAHREPRQLGRDAARHPARRKRRSGRPISRTSSRRGGRAHRRSSRSRKRRLSRLREEVWILEPKP